MQYISFSDFFSALEITRILGEIRIQSENAHISGSDNYRINRMIAWYSENLYADEATATPSGDENGRVADLTPIIRAYLSQCWNCTNCYKDCWMKYIDDHSHSANNRTIRGPCEEYGPRFNSEGGSP